MLTIVLALGLAAGSPQPESSTLEPCLHLSLASGMVLSGADIATTEYLIGRAPDRFREANPLFRSLVEHPVAMGAVKMGVYAATSYALLKLHRKYPKRMLAASLIANAVFGWAVWHNSRLVRQ